MSTQYNFQFQKDFLFFNQNKDYFLLDILQDHVLALLGLVLILFNLFFKITAAPFQFWAPSVYGKAPRASVTFLAIFLKVVIFFVLFKLLYILFHTLYIQIMPLLFLSSILSVCFGIFGALSEKITKKFFVYSSMGHVGFMLAGLSISNLNGATATFHYLFVYMLTSFLLWYILFFLGAEKNHIVDLAELKNSNVLLALLFTLIGFSMSGIPPLAGFFIKFNIFCSLMEVSKYSAAILLLGLTLPSFFYYLRFIKIIWFDGEVLRSQEDNLDLTFQKTEHSDVDAEGETLAYVYAYLAFPLVFYIFFSKHSLIYIESELLFSLF